MKIAAFFLLCTLLGATAAPPEFTPAAVFSGAKDNPGGAPPGSRRSAVGKFVISDEGQKGNGYLFNLFPGIAPIIQLAKTTGYGHGMDRSSVVYRGRGATWEVSIVGNRGAYAGTLRHESTDTFISIEAQADGTTRVTERRIQDMDPEGDAVDHGHGTDVEPAVHSKHTPQAITYVDVLILYTQALVNKRGESGAIALLDLCVVETNANMERSAMQMRIRGIKYKHSTYNEAGVGSSSTLLTFARSDPEVLAARTTYGGDAVAYVGELSGFESGNCGRGYIGPSKTYMVGVGREDCVTGYFTFGHELGHNFGCYHDRGSSGGDYGYRYGYQEPNGRFRTVMAYNCPGGCSRRGYYANPDVSISISGISYPTGITCSNADGACCAKRHDDVAAAVASYYPSTFCGGGCQNGGTCVDETCQCPNGFSGTFCEIDSTPCDPNPCVHGTCAEVSGSYSCTCDAGWEGDKCDVNINDCTPNICGTNGKCVDLVNNFTCVCATGYEGRFCENVIDNCTPNPCPDSVTCYNGIGTYVCGDCKDAPCLNGGTCTASVDGYSCACPAGALGTNCECTAQVGCNNDGVCDVGVGEDCRNCPNDCAGRTKGKPNSQFCCGRDVDCSSDSRCGVCTYTTDNAVCPPGPPPAECDPNPCLNGGVCSSSSPGTFDCSCPLPYSGQTCECQYSSGACGDGYCDAWSGEDCNSCSADCVQEGKGKKGYCCGRGGTCDSRCGSVCLTAPTGCEADQTRSTSSGITGLTSESPSGVDLALVLGLSLGLAGVFGICLAFFCVYRRASRPHTTERLVMDYELGATVDGGPKTPCLVPTPIDD
uniref:EGF-like domain-containing protein n=1 Tax=Eutreptiella gymnastica TaxID=73025 RepID=A0A7S1NT43_9EUGL|mmetsp:Transcript_88715/g.153969  ORF Transcript_88715/g.153969 Transcript_88715/m.153969 type:complete len:822 (+) Transcript_88715:36-2501(+)